MQRENLVPLRVVSGVYFRGHVHVWGGARAALGDWYPEFIQANGPAERNGVGAIGLPALSSRGGLVRNYLLQSGLTPR